MKGKLRTKLTWRIIIEEDIPPLNIKIDFDKEESKKTKIIVLKKNKNGRDSSTNSYLF